MSIILGSMAIDTLAIIITLVAGIIVYFKWKLRYWERKGIEVIPPMLFLGNNKDILTGKTTSWEQSREFYNTFKVKGLKFAGGYSFSSPYFFLVDLEIVKHVMQVDFSHFVNHGSSLPRIKEDHLWHGILFNLEDAEWKAMREKLTSTFTSGKMKRMFSTIADTAKGLKEVMDVSVKDKTPVDIKEILARFTTDIIGSCAFGIECNSLKDPETDFNKYGKKIFRPSLSFKYTAMLAMLLPVNIAKMLHIRFTPKDIEEFFMNLIRETVDYREQNNIYRNDLMHLLLQLKNGGKVTDGEKLVEDSDRGKQQGLTVEQLAAQAFGFFLAGFETSSTLMTFAVLELAHNQEAQSKLRQEINEVLAKQNGEVTYDGMMEMTYMDKVLKETLRMYPPLPIVQRVCTKDYIIPGTNITIEEGTRVRIPVLGIQRDSEYYQNPDVFDPDHFSDDPKNRRHHYAWIPFGEGPRLCIGMRFGLLQSKVGLVTLLRNYRVTLNRKTKHPVALNKNALIPQVEGGVWIDVKKIE